MRPSYCSEGPVAVVALTRHRNHGHFIRFVDVAVIIPLYNGAQWIEETLQSVLAQTHCPQEVVVVDDGSEDGSRALVRSSFPEVKLLENPGEGGSGAGPARRFGLQHTTAPLVAFLDQDDLWHPDHLRILARLLRDSKNPAAVAGLDHFQESSTPTYNLDEEGVQDFSPWERFPLNTIHSPSCVLIRREALDRIGGWPRQFTISDMHAWFKLTTRAPMLRTEKVSVGKRVHDESFLIELRTENAFSFLQQHIRVCEDALAFREEVSSEDQHLFRDRLDTFKMIGEALEGVRQGEPGRLREVARYLEHESNTEQEKIREFWFFLLRLFSMPRSQFPTIDTSKQRQLLGQIVREWPNQGRQPRRALSRALIQTISYKAFLRSVLHTPFQAATSVLFLECMMMQFERAVESTADSVRASVDAMWDLLVKQLQVGAAAANWLRSRS